MTKILDPGDPEQALARLSQRTYSEEGIPMLLIVETRVGIVAGIDPRADEVGAALHVGIEVFRTRKGEPESVDLARLIEWVADETFGPAVLSSVNVAARDA
jgi:hypothetical protein